MKKGYRSKFIRYLLLWLEFKVHRKIYSAARYVYTFIKWFLLSVVIGLFTGLVGALFQTSIRMAAQYRMEHDFIIGLLPLGGLLTVALYHLFHVPFTMGTNDVLNSIHSDKKVPIALAPVIFLGTVLTHLLGGSAGREGAALQLGGCLGIPIGRFFKLDKSDMSLAILCGMSGVFAALFGTPLTATFFAMEILSVGLLCYPCFLPCLISSLIACYVSVRFGLVPPHYIIQLEPVPGPGTFFQVMIIALICALASILFCVLLTHPPKYLARLCPNNYLRIFIGGCLLAFLTFCIGNQNYNGTGSPVIEAALNGHARFHDFILKFLFTVITLNAGYKGGAIIPAFFIGAALGGVTAAWIGINPGFGAAIGLVTFFCASVNCPIASLILSIELFGSNSIALFALACGVSYMLSGYYGLFVSQNIVYSKLKALEINVHAK